MASRNSGDAPSSPMKVLLLPPTILAGNKGDEAMFHVILTRLSQDPSLHLDFPFPRLPTLVNFKIRWSNTRNLESSRAVSLRLALWILHISIKLIFKKHVLAVVGADAFDGNQRYLFLLLVQALLGRKIFVFGCSYKNNPGILSKLIFKLIPQKLLFVCNRDQPSLLRFQRFTGKPSARVGDLAFLLNPGPLHERKIIDFLEETKAQKLLTIFPAIRGGFSLEHTTSGFTTALENFPNHRILIVNHAGGQDNRLLCEAIFDRLSHKKLFIDDIHIRELRTILKEADFALSSLLHPSIACLTQGIPCALVEYANKATGIFQDFACSELLLSDPKDFSDKSLWIKENNRAIRDRIERHLKGVQDLSELNFKYFFDFTRND